MDRRKNLLPIWLIVTPIILGTAFVFWPFPFAAAKTANAISGRQSTLQVKPPLRAHATPVLKTPKVRPAYQPLAPRLLPHPEMRQLQAALPDNPTRRDPPQKLVHPTAFPLPVKAVPVPVKASGPRYSWLLEGRAGVPADANCRSFQLERIARQADMHTRRGFSLANRGAYYSARAEFVKALRLAAQGLDIEHQTPVHGRALRAGLKAMKEADDFIPSGSQLESDLDLQAIINTHQTPALKLSQPRTLTSLGALRRYLGFAQYQLAVAAGQEVAGSMALHAMGKLYASSVDNPTVNVISARAKAMACFQAALVSYPQNYMASNDLGVLLANSGRLEDARRILESSVETCPHSTSWQNLAVVYRQLDLPELSEQAQRDQQLSRQREIARREAAAPGASDPRVSWLSSEEFAKTYAQAADSRRPLPLQQAPVVAQKPKKPNPPAKKSPIIEEHSASSWSWNILKNAFK
jgi:tetratricopeptide (TPR) repeat protein